MRKTLIASTALLLVAGSPAGAGMLLGSTDNDHKAVVNTWAFPSGQADQYTVRAEARAYGATIATSQAQLGTRAFILSATENDHKKVENGYAR